jgi:hypothetical protein
VIRGHKRARVDYEDGVAAKGDEEFLPEEGEGGNLSKQVKELMAK